MEPLDLTKAPPRSPWVKLGGCYMLARTIDKLRASLPGGNIGPYRIPGFSERLMKSLGIEEEELRTIVARASSDDEVLKWVQARCDTSKFEELNQRLATRRICDLDDVPAFKQRYPIVAEKGFPDDTVLFDLLDKDDAAMFATSPR
jgi:hypothetical protein